LSSTVALPAPSRSPIPIVLPQLQTASSFCVLLHPVLGFIVAVLNSILTFPLSSVTLDFMRAPLSPPLAPHFRIDVSGTSQILLPHMAADGATRCFRLVIRGPSMEIVRANITKNSVPTWGSAL
jgi:hypothetical protein